MRKKTWSKILLLAVSAILMMALTACGEEKSGNTIDEPEITAEYLHGEYSEQLLTDGASTMIGDVDITKDGDSYTATITEKEVVPSSDYEEGYYIADTNISREVPLGLYARMTIFADGEETIVDADGFIEADGSDDGIEELYTVYLMGDSAELILATDPVDVMEE